MLKGRGIRAAILMNIVVVAGAGISVKVGGQSTEEGGS